MRDDDNYDEYDEILSEIKKHLAGLGEKTKPLEGYIDELVQRTSDVRSLTGRLEAIRNEIIDPVNQRLAKTHTSSQRSLYVGIGSLVIAFAMAIVTLSLSILKADPNPPMYQDIKRSIQDTDDSIVSLEQRTNESLAGLQRMMQRVLAKTGSAPFPAEDLEPVEGQVELDRFKKVTLLQGEQQKVALELYDVHSVNPSEDEPAILVGDFRLYINDRLVGSEELNNVIGVDSIWPRGRIDSSRRANVFRLAEEDKIAILDIHRFSVIRIASVEPLGRSLADDRIVAYILPIDHNSQ
jgi:hypothetical protein